MLHVLIIEDDVRLADRYREMSLAAGAASAEIATSEEMAIDAARRYRPAIIVSDIDLARGGRGPDAVMRIRALLGAIPAIFVTGDPEDRAANELASAVLAKPCSAERFNQAVSAYLNDKVH